MVGDGCLGCGAYQVFAAERGVLTSLIATLPWSTLHYDRKLDETSTAEVSTVGPAWSCCPDGSLDCGNDIQNLRPWRHELVILSDGVRVWMGPITRIEVLGLGLKIQARDVSAWWWRRWVHNDYNVIANDLGDSFAHYVNDAMAVDLSPNISYRATFAGVPQATCPVVLTGVTGDRAVLAADHRIAGEEIQELTRTACDWTCVEHLVTVGGVELVGPPIVLVDEHFTTPPVPVIDGMEIATGVGIIGQDPTIQGEASQAPDLFGVLETTYAELSIRDAGSAGISARTRLERQRPQDPITGVEVLQAFVADGVLSPDAPFSINDLVPGVQARVILRRSCIPIDGIYRLQGASFDAQVTDRGETETVQVQLQPVGTELHP